MWIEETFPELTRTGYEVTSDINDDYNCIAWAVGDNKNWWSHLPGYRWSERRGPEVECLLELFAGLGFETCESSNLEEGYDKVAIFAIEGCWSHAARILPDGRWTSKLGGYEDITHPTVEALNGALYGNVHCVMRRAVCQ